MISEVLRTTLGTEHPLIFILFPTIKAVGMDSPEINQQDIEPLLYTELWELFKINVLYLLLLLIVLLLRCFLSFGCLFLWFLLFSFLFIIGHRFIFVRIF